MKFVYIVVKISTKLKLLVLDIAKLAKTLVLLTIPKSIILSAIDADAIMWGSKLGV
jgi:hypothetical protein